MSRLPIRFEENRGQARPAVKFLARGGGYAMFFTPSESIIALKARRGFAEVRFRFAGASRAARLEGAGDSQGPSHYFIGRDPRAWHTSVPSYSRIAYRGLYPGIDLVYYGGGADLEYDLVLQPGADASRLQFDVDGATSLKVDAAGDLVIGTAAGELRQLRPRVKGARASYQLASARRVRIAVDGWDGRSRLTIDPVLAYATFFGGSGLDSANSVTLDGSGNIYVAGETLSADFPATQPPAYNAGELPGDAFVMKLNPTGTAIIWASFVGGRRQDIANRVVVDSSGAVYIAGWTNSPDFPVTAGVVQGFLNMSGPGDILGDGFVAKLNPSGSSLVWATYMGGDDVDVITALAVDGSGDTFVAGYTASSNFPTRFPALRTVPCLAGGNDGFVAQLNPTATAYVYSTYVCGSANDQIWDLTIDPTGSAYITGETNSTDFPVAGGYSTTGGGTYSDAFALKLNPTGTTVIWGTYLSGSADDAGRAIFVDSGLNVYVAGYTYSPDFPTTAGAPRAPSPDLVFAEDAFVLKLNPAGSALVYSTLLGGSGADRAYGLVVDPQGEAVVVGGTSSSDFAPPAVCQPGYGGAEDAFIAKVNGSGNGLVYVQTLGGSANDRAYAVALNPQGDAVFVGQTFSANMPTPDVALRPVYAKGYQGAGDAFLARMSDGPGPAPPCISMGGVVNAASFLPLAVAPGELITIFGAGIGPDALANLQLDTNGRVATTLAQTRVLFDGIAAPLFYASSTQTSAFVPYEVQTQASTVVQVEYNGVRTPGVTVPVTASQPGVLYNFGAGPGQALLWNQDFTFNSLSNPAARGSFVFLWGTGEGETDPPGVDGQVNTTVYPTPRLKVSVTVGGVDAPIQYAAAAPQVVAGVIQINFQVPDSVRPGSQVPLVVRIGDNQSQPGLTIAVK